MSLSTSSIPSVNIKNNSHGKVNDHIHNTPDTNNRIPRDCASVAFSPTQQQQQLKPTSRHVSFETILRPALTTTRPTLSSSSRPLPVPCRHQEALIARHHFYATRQHQRRAWHDHVSNAIMLRKYRDKMIQLRQKARLEYQLRSAAMRREMILLKHVEQCASHSDRVACVSVLHGFKKYLRYDNHASELTTFQPLNMNELEGEYADEAKSAVPTVLRRSVQFDQSGHVETSPTSTLSISSDSEDSDENPFYTSLEVVFGNHNLPPITHESLQELDLDQILTDVQLRHDMLFDANLEFKPNTSGDRFVARQKRMDEFWGDLKHDADGTNYGSPSFARFPVLVNEVKKIIADLVADDTWREEVNERLDVPFIAQQMERNIFDPVPLMEYISHVMLSHCAPARDEMVKTIMKHVQEGDIVEALRATFDVLEQMRLDVANDQLRRLRPFVKEQAAEFEWSDFKFRLRTNQTSLDRTHAWIERVMETKPALVSGKEVIREAFLELIRSCDGHDCQVPETFRLDKRRLVGFHADWHDLTVVAVLMMLFRQVAGRACTPQVVTDMNLKLWALLEDAETTLDHVLLFITTEAGRVRGKIVQEQESASLKTLLRSNMDKTGRVYQLLHSRIGQQIMKSLVSDNNDTLAEQQESTATNDVRVEVDELATRIKQLYQHNTIVFAKLYDNLIESIKTCRQQS